MSDLDTLARELDQRARAVQLIGDRLVHDAAIALWTSVAADAFRASVARRRADCGDVADRLRSAAGTVRRFGSQAQVERARLARLEHAAVHGVEAAARVAGSGFAQAAAFIRW